MKNIIVSFLAMVLINSCGFNSEDNDITKVVLSNKKLKLMAPQTGGVMVYIIGQDLFYERAISLSSDSEEKVVELKNGIYKFVAVGWDGATQLDGQGRCGEHDEELSGGEEIIDITLNSTNCGYGGQSIYFDSGDDNGSSNFRFISVQVCQVGGFPSCTNDTTYANNSSVKLTLSEYINDDSGTFISDGLTSNCVSCNGSTTCNATVADLPLGNTSTSYSKPFYTKLEIWTGTTTCTGSPARTYVIPEGLANVSDAPEASNLTRLSGATILFSLGVKIDF